MVRLNRITTKQGDKGATTLADGTRVAKHDLRIVAQGSVDELNAVLGLALLVLEGEAAAVLTAVQNDLFDLGADIAVPEAAKADGSLRIGEADVARLDTVIEKVNAGLEPLESFILPGGTPAAAHLHLARTVARRAERDFWAFAEVAEANPLIGVYLNRLSDLLFVMARAANDGGRGDVLWVPGGSSGG